MLAFKILKNGFKFSSEVSLSILKAKPSLKLIYDQMAKFLSRGERRRYLHYLSSRNESYRGDDPVQTM